MTPTMAIVFIVTHWANGDISSGTGSLVGQNDILTATHVVYNPDRGGWADNFDFYFVADYDGKHNVMHGYDTAMFNQGDGDVEVFAWNTGVYSDDDNATLQRSESQHDNAIIGISQPKGDTYGWFSMNPFYNYTTYATAYGFPLGCDGIVSERLFVTPGITESIYLTNSNTMGVGSSGGPLVVNGEIIGVKSAGSGSYGTWTDIGPVMRHMRGIISQNDHLIKENIK